MHTPTTLLCSYYTLYTIHYTLYTIHHTLGFVFYCPIRNEYSSSSIFPTATIANTSTKSYYSKLHKRENNVEEERRPYVHALAQRNDTPYVSVSLSSSASSFANVIGDKEREQIARKREREGMWIELFPYLAEPDTGTGD